MADEVGPEARAVTAQHRFKAMMRDLVTPVLRDLGFQRRTAQEYACRRGEHEGCFRTDKRSRNTKQELDFRVLLWQVHVPTCTSYWDRDLFALIPGSTDTWWTVYADTPAEPVAGQVLNAFRSYGWPAIQAAIDSPGEPPDPAVQWPRRFLPLPESTGRRSGQVIYDLQDAGRVTDALFAKLETDDHWFRRNAARQICLDALDDPRAVPALLTHLEHDPSPHVREAIAQCLRPIASDPDVLGALRAAAAQDEDAQVRWAARYAQL